MNHLGINFKVNFEWYRDEKMCSNHQHGNPLDFMKLLVLIQCNILTISSNPAYLAPEAVACGPEFASGYWPSSSSVSHSVFFFNAYLTVNIFFKH